MIMNARWASDWFVQPWTSLWSALTLRPATHTHMRTHPGSVAATTTALLAKTEHFACVCDCECTRTCTSVFVWMRGRIRIFVLRLHYCLTSSSTPTPTPLSDLVVGFCCFCSLCNLDSRMRSWVHTYICVCVCMIMPAYIAPPCWI